MGDYITDQRLGRLLATAVPKRLSSTHTFSTAAAAMVLASATEVENRVALPWYPDGENVSLRSALSGPGYGGKKNAQDISREEFSGRMTIFGENPRRIGRASAGILETRLPEGKRSADKADILSRLMQTSSGVDFEPETGTEGNLTLCICFLFLRFSFVSSFGECLWVINVEAHAINCRMANTM